MAAGYGELPSPTIVSLVQLNFCIRLVFSSKGTVSVLIEHGMVVHLSSHIKGLVPRTHLSDILLKNPERKYVPGMKIKCRVSQIPFLFLFF